MKTTQPQIVLPDTSLCAIVRDEIMNPAGGIVDFVDSTLPYVEAGVIVDTGSRDGTREALENLKSKYSHLQVYDLEFQGFAHARNYSLKQAKTKRALVLDADERLTKKDFKELMWKLRLPNTSLDYSFEILHIYNDWMDGSATRELWNPRLFEIAGVHFSCEVGEVLSGKTIGVETGISIKHFRPPYEICIKKNEEFYNQLYGKSQDEIKTTVKPLRDFPFFKEVRQYNSKRENYR